MNATFSNWKDLGAINALAAAGDFEQAIAMHQKALADKSLNAQDRAKMEKRLERYRQKRPYREED